MKRSLLMTAVAIALFSCESQPTSPTTPVNTTPKPIASETKKESRSDSFFAFVSYSKARFAIEPLYIEMNNLKL